MKRTWAGADPPGLHLHEELGRILNLFLFPGVASLTVHTACGNVIATRDFPSGIGQDVDDALRRLFCANPAVTGVTFPATPTRPAHTATLDSPFWSPLGQASAVITAVPEAGTITPGQATGQLQALYGSDAPSGPVPEGLGMPGPS